jgi:uncharacterized protein YjbI with pentapeptide repeats
MANQEHLAKLREEGVKAWNQWRQLNPHTAVDLSSGDLSSGDLSSGDLSGANLSRANLMGADLREADLRETNLSEADLSNADLTEAHLSQTNFMGADLSETDFSGADLRDAYLREAYLGQAKLMGADLREADLSGTDLSNAYLMGADLRQAKLSKAKLRDAHLGQAKLMGADFNRADLRDAKLMGADLIETDFSGADLSRATLMGADLSKANFSGTDLSEADLSKANLIQANLQEADLRSACLQSANLDGANATGIHLWETQRAGWSIKGIICEHVYWNKERIDPTAYAPGEFERLYAEQPIIQLFYEDGLSKFELNTLPALLQHLATLHPDCNIRLKSVEETGGGAKVSIIVEGANGSVFDEVNADAQRAHAAQIAVRDDRITQLEIEQRLLLDEVFPRMLAAAGHHVHIGGSATGVLIASGPASINAPVTVNDLPSILPLLTEIMNRRVDLSLPENQETRLETAIQSVQEELKKEKPKTSVVTESLKIVKEIAVKAAVNAAEKADWHSMMNQLTHLIHTLI